MFELTTFIFSPSVYIRGIAGTGPKKLWPLALFLVLLIPLCHSFSAAMSAGTNIASFGLGMLSSYWVKTLLFGAAILFSGGFVFFAASLVNRGENAPRVDAGVFTVLYLASWFPVAFSPAFTLAVRQLGNPGTAFSALGWIAVFAWIIILQISVVRYAFGMNLLKSILVWAAAGIIGQLLSVLLVVYAAAAFLSGAA